jgi:phosphate:Na+ symporter
MNEQSVDIWLFLAGVGIFLFGIYLLEESIAKLSGRAFKQFVRKYTDTPLRGIVSGTLATAVLQSSSAVMLMVIAFAGAGIMPLRNAIGVIFGSNLGTTLTSWVVATLGFKIQMEEIFLPIIGIGGLGLIFMGKSAKGANVSKLLVGFGFLFMGLDYMKSSIEKLAVTIDFLQFEDYPSLFFMLASFVLTAIVQSSSASMAIVLSFVFSGAISFENAAAMVIGTNIGTTITVFIGSIGGPIIKKQISVSHFLFNFITGIVILIFLPFITKLFDQLSLSNQDPVLALALFHTLYNVSGIILFLPIIKPFESLLLRMVQKEKPIEELPLSELTAEVPEAGINSLKNALRKVLLLTSHYNIKMLKMDASLLLPFYAHYQKASEMPLDKHYHLLNKLQLQLITYAADIQRSDMTKEESAHLNQLLLATRYFITAAKSMKDASEQLNELPESEAEIMVYWYQHYRKFALLFYQKIIPLLEETDQTHIMTVLHELRSDVITMDIHFVRELTKALSQQQLSPDDADFLLKFNRGFILNGRQMIVGCREMLLNPNEAVLFENIEKLV